MCVVTGMICMYSVLSRDETDGSLHAFHACNSALAHPDNLN